MKEFIEKNFVKINEERVEFYIYRKKVKNINLRVDKEKNIIISMPFKMSSERAKDFVKEKINWINKQKNQLSTLKSKKDGEIRNGNSVYILGKIYEIVIKEGKVNSIIKNEKNIEFCVRKRFVDNEKYLQKIYDNWLKEYELQIIKQIINNYQKELLDKYYIKFPEIQIRKMKSRWGCCFPFQNKVVFNLSLIKTPIECVDYVVLHELSHFKYKNHSKDFYRFIEIYMKNWKEKRKILNKEYFNI